jgi:branched-chain amino acid transport system permease protein
MMLPVLQSNHPGLAGLAFVVIGFGAVALGRDPNGLANLLFALGRKVESALWPAVADRLPRRASDPVGKHRHSDDTWPKEIDTTQVVPTEEVPGYAASRG